LSKKVDFVYSQEDQKAFEQVQNKYWKAALFDHENEEELLVLDYHRELIRIGAE